jgi:EAL domain-containing protein (putative c-di-GMP-specific phosphodiesterase class I)/GGDEF domain-containing protein
MSNIKSYLEVQSEIHVQDTATSLGLSLSPYMSNDKDPIIRTMMNAIFDMGYYKKMTLVDVDDNTLVILNGSDKIEGVPSWLISLVPMKASSVISEISSGWNISGTLTITSNPGYAYLKLYQQGKETLKYSLIIFLIAIGFLIITLRFTLRPLRAIEKQANDISAGNFTIIENLPWTLEVKSVAQSMNSMSLKIGEIIARLNSKLASLSENLKRDPLTKLLNQATFYVNLKEIMSMRQSGYAALIKFDDLASIAKNNGNDIVNQLLIKFAQLLENVQQSTPSSSAYRIYGSEFALLCPTMDKEQIIKLAESLKLAIADLGQQYHIDDLVHMGIIRFERSSDFNKLSPAMIEAYEQSRKIGHNAYFIQQESISSMSELDWKSTITNVIENNMPEIKLISEAYNYEANSPLKVMEEAFTLVKDTVGNTLSIGTFFSMAQEFGLEEELDKCIVNKIITLLETTHQSVPVTINLSMSSISSASFGAWLKLRIEQSDLSPQILVFSVTAYSAVKNITAFANFNLFIKSLGAATILKRYSSDIIAIDLLKDLHIDYIRLARDLTCDIGANTNKSDLLDIMQEVSSLLDIKVIAENVIKDEDFEYVKKSGVYGIGR